MERILRFLSKTSALLFTPILFLLKTILLNIGLTFTYALLGLLVILGSPLLLAAYFIVFAKRDPALTVFLSILAAPVLILGSAILVSLALIVIAVVNVFDLVRSLGKGLKLGATHHWDEIIDALGKNEVLEFSFLTLPILMVSSLIFDNEGHGISEQDFNALNQEDEESSSSEEQASELKRIQFKQPDLMPAKEYLLAAENNPKFREELIQAKRLFNQHEQNQLLKTLIGQYEDLNARLTKLNDAISSNSLYENGDELVMLGDIEQPILVVKEYEIEKGKWLTIPASTKLSDKVAFKTWLEHNAVHPLFNDRIKSPEKYNKYNTRYKWYDYQGECFELNELASKIRLLTKSLEHKNVKENEKNKLVAKSLGLTIWSRPETSFVQEIPHEENHTSESSLSMSQ